MLFSRLNGADARSAELDQQWLTLEELIGIERLDQFLGHHRSSLVATKARTALHEEFRPLVEAAENPFNFLEQLTASAQNYLRIQRGDFQTAAARRAIRSLHRVAFEEWIPPLLAFLNAPVGGMTEAEFVDRLERITYQNSICRLAFTARLTVYFQLITAIRTGRAAATSMPSLARTPTTRSSARCSTRTSTAALSPRPCSSASRRLTKTSR